MHLIVCSLDFSFLRNGRRKLLFDSYNKQLLPPLVYFTFRVFILCVCVCKSEQLCEVFFFLLPFTVVMVIKLCGKYLYLLSYLATFSPFNLRQGFALQLRMSWNFSWKVPDRASKPWSSCLRFTSDLIIGLCNYDPLWELLLLKFKKQKEARHSALCLKSQYQ